MHNPVNDKQSDNCEGYKLEMIFPSFWLFGCKGWRWDVILLRLWSGIVRQSLTGSHLYCTVVSVWFSLYWFRFSHGRDYSMWFIRLIIVSLEMRMNCFINYVLFFYWFGSRGLHLWFWFSLRLGLFFGSLCLASAEFRDWVLFLLSWSAIDSVGRFSLSDWRFHCSLSFETLDDFLKSESGLLNVHFEFKGELIWNVHLLLESVGGVLSEFLDIVGWIDVDTS